MRNRGFTLIEMLTTITIVSVLAVVAMGGWRKHMNSARRSEVYSMFAEIRAKEEAYRAEFSSYLGSGGSEDSYWPVLGGNEPTVKTWAPSPGNWSSLGI